MGNESSSGNISHVSGKDAALNPLDRERASIHILFGHKYGKNVFLLDKRYPGPNSNDLANKIKKSMNSYLKSNKNALSNYGVFKKIKTKKDVKGSKPVTCHYAWLWRNDTVVFENVELCFNIIIQYTFCLPTYFIFQLFNN